MKPHVNLHIDRLILDGVPLDGLDADVLSNEVRLALASVLAARGLRGSIAAGGAWDSIRGAEIAAAEAHPDGLGTRIAHAIHAGLEGKEGTTP